MKERTVCDDNNDSRSDSNSVLSIRQNAKGVPFLTPPGMSLNTPRQSSVNSAKQHPFCQTKGPCYASEYAHLLYQCPVRFLVPWYRLCPVQWCLYRRIDRFPSQLRRSQCHLLAVEIPWHQWLHLHQRRRPVPASLLLLKEKSKYLKRKY